MTILELISIFSKHSTLLIIIFMGIPAFTLVYHLSHPQAKSVLSPYKYVYAVLVYISCIPGIFASVLTAYSLFFLQSNLLQVNYLVYFLPIISMIATLLLLSKWVDLDFIPGFDRLRGLMILLSVTFILALMIVKTNIWILFGGSLSAFFIIVAVLFLLLKWTAHIIFRQKKISN